MSLTLYGAARSRASMIRWYLAEKGIPYQWQVLDLGAGEQRQPDFLAINPFGKVPALVDASFSGADGEPLKLAESGAILLHLAEQHAREFSGDRGDIRRSLSLQWVLFANASFGPAMIGAAQKPEPLLQLLGQLDPLLARGGNLLDGPCPTAPWGVADCAVQAYLAYLPLFCAQVDLSPFPAVQATIAATQAREAYRQVMAA